jgi:succinate dehydrogenase hydrophobic anchor subunit
VAVAIFLATLSAAAWTVLMKASELGSVAGNAPNLTFREAVQYQVLNRWAGFLNEMVGVTSWLDAQPPGWAYTVWFGVVGSLVVWALALGGWVDRWRLVAVTAVAFAVPTVADAMNVNKYGFVSQGRYMLPLAVGVPIIAAFVLGRSGVLDDLRTRKLVRATAVILMPLQLVFLWFTMIRWQSGYTTAAGHSRINAFAGSWHPQVGSVLPVLFAVAGAAALLAFSWTATNAKVPSVRPAQRHPLHARI